MRSARGHNWKRHALLVLLGASFLAFSQMPKQSIHDPSITTPPDKNQQMQMQDDQSKKQKFEAANTERKRQIADDASKLLELATQLKAEVDKTGRDTLSLQVIRKAESIEKLARSVKEKMKLTAGTS